MTGEPPPPAEDREQLASFQNFVLGLVGANPCPPLAGAGGGSYFQ